MPICSKCKVEKSTKDFYKRSNRKRGIASECKECAKKANKDYYIKSYNPEEKAKYYQEHKKHICASQLRRYYADPERYKFYQLKSKYGLTKEQWESLIIKQEGKCAACKGIPNEWQVDHDHKCCSDKKSCGKCIRALLCASCNTVLGFVKDNPEILEKQAAYLRSFGGI